MKYYLNISIIISVLRRWSWYFVWSMRLRGWHEFHGVWINL